MAKKLDPIHANARRLINSGQYRQAAGLLNDAANKRPKEISYYVAAAQVLTRFEKRPDVSMQVLRRALKVAPQNALILQEAIHANLELKNRTMAENFAERLLKCKGILPDQYAICAKAFTEAHRYEDAHKCLETALKGDPDHKQAQILFASSLSSLGRFEEAIDLSRKLLNEDPFSFSPLNTYVESQKITEGDPVCDRLETVVLPKVRLESTPEIQDGFLRAYAKCLEDTGRHTEAFRTFQEAKSVNPYGHDRSVFQSFVRTIKSSVAVSDFFGAPGFAEQRPVLIVGMPRVGSTLLEQVLSSHPKTGGVGESGALSELRELTKVNKYDGARFAELVKKPDPDLIDRLRARYLAQTAETCPGAERVVDKYLYNFEQLGLFARMFPKGRVIHALRDPMDNCVACYLRNLDPAGHSYIGDLASLGQFYREHRELMDHWKKVLPIPIMQVSYEDMVADTEVMARKIIDFLGLEWDPACLEFQQTAQQVRTLSSWQVRQPIYKSSVKRWKRYEEFLDPLKKELEVFYPDGFDA